MLSGNFKEEYITGIRDEIREMSQTYRALFGECSVYLEKMGTSAFEANVLKGLGSAGKAVGKFIGSIPLVKEGPVDEFLQEKGFVDMIVERKKMRKTLAKILSIHAPEEKEV